MAVQRKVRARKKVPGMKVFTIRMQASLVFVFFIIILLFLALMGRLLYLNYEKGAGYAKQVLSQQTYMSSVIPYKRGDITDRKGTLFATSEMVYNLIVEPKTILEKEDYYREPTLSALVNVFGFSREELNQVLEDKPNSLYVVLKKEVTFEQKTAFKELADQSKNHYIQGVWFEEQYRRIYPLGTVASDLIGFTSSGNVGNWGVEGYYNQELNGTNGREYGYFDSELNLEETVKDAVDGYNVVTTLDADAQKAVEQIIAQYQKSEGAKNVAVILMNPNSGEIYVMATDKGYDLNDPRNLSGYYSEAEIAAMSEEEQLDALNQIWRNFCISDIYEPGSTFKPFTVAACLEEAIVGKEQWFVCDGFEMVGGQRINCVKRVGHGNITLQESLMNSCNDVMMQISSWLGRTSFNRYQRLFGMGARTGIDLQGESSGLIFTEEQLNSQELATSSFGQGLTVTMIQMVSGFSSLINGGNYYQPHVMQELTDNIGTTVKEYTPVLVKKTVTKSTSDFIRDALYATVEQGTAKKAQAAGYQVGGKTGTAQKQPRGEENYVLSFLGFVPYEEPELVVYVLLDEPQVEDQTKCTSATEMASRIIREIGPILGVYPTEPVETEDTKEDTKEDTPQSGDGEASGQGSSDSAENDGTEPINSDGGNLEAGNNATGDGGDTITAEDGDSGDGTQADSQENEDATHIYD